MLQTVDQGSDAHRHRAAVLSSRGPDAGLWTTGARIRWNNA